MTNEEAYLAFLRIRARRMFYESNFPLLGFSPMPYQAPFIGSQAKISVFSGGNRAGKTTAGAFKAAALANGVLGHFYPGFPKDGGPNRGWVSALDYRLAKTVVRKLGEMLGKTVRRWNERDMMFTLHNGSEIVIKSEESGEQKYQAEDIHWCWKDEAGPTTTEGIFNEILRSLTDHNGPIFMTMTPTLGSSWVGMRLYEPWRDGTNDTPGVIHNNVAFFFGSSENNQHLSRKGLEMFMSQQTTEEQRLVRLHGRFITLEGLVYSMFRPERHVIDGFIPPLSWARYIGMDFGLDAPSTAVFGAVEPPTPTDPEKSGDCPCPAHLRPHSTPRLHIYRLVYDDRPGHTVKMTVETTRREMGEDRFNRIVLDPSCWNQMAGPEAVGGHFVVAHEYERHGLFPEQANNDVESSVERIWGMLGRDGEQPSILIHRNCEKLIWELRRQKWKRSGGGLLLNKAPGGMGDRIDKSDSDHAIDGLRYLVACDPLQGGMPSLFPTEDPFPYRESDWMGASMTDDEDEPLVIPYQ